MQITRGGTTTAQAAVVARTTLTTVPPTAAESAAAQNDLLLEVLLELKLITLHQAEIAGTTFEQEDVRMELK